MVFEAKIIFLGGISFTIGHISFTSLCFISFTSLCFTIGLSERERERERGSITKLIIIIRKHV